MSMVTIEIRDVPEDVFHALAVAAESRGQSLQDYLLSLLEEAAEHALSAAKANRLDPPTDQ